MALAVKKKSESDEVLEKHCDEQLKYLLLPKPSGS